MPYTISQIAWMFFIYSFLGWIGEVCAAAFQKRHFINRGFVNSPLCPIYGVASVLFALFLPELTSRPVFLFLAGAVISTVLEYSTGKLLETIFHKKLWDYSSIPWNLDGYICLRYSILWGILAVVLMRFFNPLFSRITDLIPELISTIGLWCLSGILALDFISTALAVLGMQKKADRFAQLTEGLQHTSALLENALTKRIQSRMVQSFPAIDLHTLGDLRSQSREKKKTSTVFAEGCGFYKLASLFFLGAFLGDLTETIFCLFTMKKLMSRSSVVYGPFSIVWGLGCTLLTALLYRYREKSDRSIFWAGTLLGGMYEYICSVFTEMVFGTVFWDYSGFAFNLGGRINLLYCFFWGFAAIVWLKVFYPFLSGLIEKLPMKLGKVLCHGMILFMIFDIAVSGLAINRYMERNSAKPDSSQTAAEITQDSALDAWLDKHFDDHRIVGIYPNMKIVGEDGVPVSILQ